MAIFLAHRRLRAPDQGVQSPCTPWQTSPLSPAAGHHRRTSLEPSRDPRTHFAGVAPNGLSRLTPEAAMARLGWGPTEAPAAPALSACRTAAVKEPQRLRRLRWRSVHRREPSGLWATRPEKNRSVLGLLGMYMRRDPRCTVTKRCAGRLLLPREAPTRAIHRAHRGLHYPPCAPSLTRRAPAPWGARHARRSAERQRPGPNGPRAARLLAAHARAWRGEESGGWPLCRPWAS